jgi:ketosteroid isomerase-like protein
VDYGRDQIRAAEQADYDAVDLSVEFTPVDALQVTDDWVCGIAEVDGVATTKADRTQTPIRFTVTWLLQKADSGSWLIARQMWHNRGSA